MTYSRPAQDILVGSKRHDTPSPDIAGCGILLWNYYGYCLGNVSFSESVGGRPRLWYRISFPFQLATDIVETHRDFRAELVGRRPSKNAAADREKYLEMYRTAIRCAPPFQRLMRKKLEFDDYPKECWIKASDFFIDRYMAVQRRGAEALLDEKEKDAASKKVGGPLEDLEGGWNCRGWRNLS